MPNRIIKESICTSEELNSVSVDAERLFYRLIVKADDHGRFFANPRIVRSLCFPLKTDEIEVNHISQWLQELAESNLLIVYTDGDKYYLQLLTFTEHQRVRAEKSKFPDIVEQLECADICGHLSASGDNYQQPLAIADNGQELTALNDNVNDNVNDNALYIYSFWNDQKIIVHGKLTDKIARAINKSLNENNIDDIKSAIVNYATIVHDSSKYFFTYKWGLKDFLNRGLEKFLDNADPLNNFLKDKGGNGRGKTSDIPTRKPVISPHRFDPAVDESD